MTLTIPGPTLPAATTDCAPILPVGWSRTRIWSIFRTGSRSGFGSPMRTGSMRGPSRSCHIARNSICGAACCCEPYASRTDRATEPVAGATSRFDGRHASGRAGTDADRRELVGNCHGPFGDRRTHRQRGCEALPATSTTNIWSRWQARSSARTASTCWCAPASRMFTSPR